MSETIEARELQLVSIFSDSYRFEIPEYQRPYAWTTEQTGELLDDLLHAMEHVENVRDASPYFLGSIVIIKNGLQPHAQLVDGQQRITTLTILLCVLRELASEESDRGDTHSYVYAPGRESAGIPGHYRLAVRERDREFFQNNVQQMGRLRSLLERSPANLPDSQRRMLENARHLFNSLAGHEERRRKILMQFIAQRCYLVVVSASDQNSAYRIFSVLNDRGLDLSPTDILKAGIIGALPESIRSRHTEIWEEIEEDLGRDRFSDLFAHIRMISMKRRQQGTLQQEFQDHVLKEVDRVDFINEVLEPYADAYATVTGASYEGTGGSGEVNTYLRYLNRLDNFDWIPPAMAFYRRNQSPEAFLRFVRDLERLAYALFIVRANVYRRTSIYADILRAIDHEEDLYGVSSPLQLSSGEIADVLSALDGPIGTLTRVRRTLLLRLDSLLADGGARYEHATISVEHVLPRNPERNSQWLRDFPDEEEREEWTDRLANLVLLSRTKNSQALNYDFNRKKTAYFQRGGVVTFALTTQVVAESEWTPEVLQRRQRELINALKKEWRLDGSSPSSPVHILKEQNKPAYSVEEKRREHPRVYDKWSPEDDERLKEMYAAGHSIAELAKQFGRNNGAIRSRLKKLGLDRGVVANPIYEETRQLVEQGLTLDEVARRRDRPVSTIVVHLERLLQEGSEIDLRHLLPLDRFEKIRSAFKRTGSTRISPIKDILGDDYSYEESRVVQLCLQQQGRATESGQLAVTDLQGAQSANAHPPTPPAFDVTAIAHRILSAVIQTGERFGITHVAAVLRGSGNKVVRRLGHDALSVYGTVDSYSVDEIKEIAGQLVEEGLLRREDGMYPTLSVTETGRSFLKSRAKLVLSLPASDERRAPTAGRAGRDNEEARRRRRQRTMREGSTYETTRQLWKQGLTVEEIAKERNLEMSTIASHFERLIEAGMDIDLRPMLPPAEKVAEIRRALTAAGVSPLSQVKELLGDDYSYFEIRIVQVFLRQQRRRSG